MLSRKDFGEKFGVSGVTIENVEKIRFRGMSPNTMRRLAEMEKAVRENRTIGKVKRVPR